jgi:S1-C subfamily serine protease
VTSCNGLEIAPLQWWGSGFIVNEDGTIVTNYHVAGKSLEGEAMFHDKSTYRITQIKVYDPVHDLAVLKIVANRRFPTVTLGNSDTIHPMDNVLAVGNPRGTGINVTDGRVSQLVQDDNNNIIMLRHTAPITGGNSGGALYKGQKVVGVNVATWPGTQFHQAVPINFVTPLLGGQYATNLPLKDIFYPNAETIIHKAKQISAQNGTVPAAASQDQPGVVTIPFNFYPLQDILFLLQTPQGKNLIVLVKGADGKNLGCATGKVLMVSTPYNAQRVGINVVNYDATPVNFGIAAFLIVW